MAALVCSSSDDSCAMTTLYDRSVGSLRCPHRGEYAGVTSGGPSPYNEDVISAASEEAPNFRSLRTLYRLV
jgi:hypothetical protein